VGELTMRSAKMDKERLYYWVLIVASVVYVALWIIAFVFWLTPMIEDRRFGIFGTLTEGKWFADDVAQIERDAVAKYFIFALPILGVFVYFWLSELFYFVSERKNRRENA
jgi:hypothetical protein